MRVSAHRRLLTSALALGSALALAACSSSGSTKVGGESISPTDAVNTVAPSPHLTPGQPQTKAQNTKPAPETTGVAAPSAPVTVNKTITDAALGRKVTVLKYVLGYQPSEAALQKNSFLADEKIVLVDVRVTAGTKHGGSFGPLAFRLAGGADGAQTPTTSTLDAELAGAGYPALKGASPGGTSTGWLIFTPRAGLSTYVLRYARQKYGTTANETIKAKNFDLPLN